MPALEYPCKTVEQFFKSSSRNLFFENVMFLNFDALSKYIASFSKG